MNNFFFDIFLIIILFYGNILINNANYYFSLIYAFLTLYHIYISAIIRKKYIIEKIEVIYFIISSFFLYFISYYFFCDPNPFFAFIFYYSFYPNFIKAILIIVIHTYFLSNIFKGKNTYKTKFFKRLSFQSEFNKKRRVSIHPYFLWKIIEYLKKKKLYSIYFIIFFVFLCLNILFFENRIRIWVYLFEKQQTLPNSFSDNKIFYIASNVVNIEDIIEVYIEEMKKLIKYLGYKNVIISIVENGDSVDNTRRYLQNFQNYLNENKILVSINFH